MGEKSHLDYRDGLRLKAQQLARAVLAGEADLLEASPTLWAILEELDLGWDDEDGSAFGTIATETEHLPVGRQRVLWASDALARKEPEIVKARRWAEEFGLPACRRIAARWCPPGE